MITKTNLLDFSVTNVNAVASYLNNIEPLNGANFPDWKGKVMTCLAWNDLDLALREDKPAAPAAGQSSAALEKWERSDRMATMVMRQTISAGIKGAIPTKDAAGLDLSAKALLAKIEENFKSSSKTYASTLIMKLVSSQYTGQTGIREHILNMCDMANRLKDMQMEISDGFLVHFIMTSLPSPQYAAFKINYNTNKNTWSISELISYCVEEEERLKTEKMKDVVNMVQHMSLNGNTLKNQHESGSSKQILSRISMSQVAVSKARRSIRRVGTRRLLQTTTTNSRRTTRPRMASCCALSVSPLSIFRKAVLVLRNG